MIPGTSPQLLNAFTTKYKQVFPQAKQLALDLVKQVENGGELAFDALRDAHSRTSDIEENLELLADHVRPQALRAGGDLPCLDVDGEPIPIASHHLLRGLAARQGFRPVHTPVQRALTGVGHHLSKFLADRIASEVFPPAGGIAGGMDPTQNMLVIEVHSHTLGGRVSYSPAYFINYINLAAPTSPVRGRILPGRYVFMVTTVGPKSVHDSQPFDVPPSFSVQLAV